MLATRVGYTGGSTPAPTYRTRADHAEAVEVTYDPSRVRYEDLLRLFWELHDPTIPAYAENYRNAVFVGEPAERNAAERSAAAIARERGKVHTTVENAGPFHAAEEVHQKFYLRRRPDLVRELEPFFGGDRRRLFASTAASRLNALLAHGTTRERAREDLVALGFPLAWAERLVRRAR